MAQTTGTSTYWNTPNYDGMLWTADVVPGQGTGTPFLTLMGGLNGGNARDVMDFDFSMSSEYDFPAASQPSISETASTTAPAATSPILSQERNTCQIFQEAIDITYKKLSTTERLATDIVQGGAGYWAKDGSNNQSGLDTRNLTYALQNIARKANYTFLNGTFALSTSSAVAAQTRGIITGATTNAIAAGGAALSKDILQSLFKTVVDNSGGQSYQNTPVIFLNSFQKQKISDIYGYQPDDWNIGGVNIQTILTDFGRVGVVYESMVPTDTVLFSAMNLVKPVFCPLDGKGRLFDEDLAKVGASERKQVYGQMGIDYANEKLHGKITNLAIV
ncbi:MAG: DUF5309 domain-containing protein [Mycoplasma sp.]|nr:DUF5309 domain-containing protein [Mycoplasma sp.]